MSRGLVVFCALLLNVVGQCQQCPGGLGENLFVAGDFGSGEEYVLQNDPQLAPGYSYVRAGPPNDGEYIITNQINRWNFVYDTWLVIGDNSDDPNGYMMVVNASFEPGLFYDEVVEGLCDNTSYEFSAEIINMIKIGVGGHSDPNVAFLIDGEVVLETGDIPKNEMWNTFSFSFDTDPGQTSVRLSLRNNAPGGTGNDLALDNISFKACGPPSEVAEINRNSRICEENFPLTLISLIDGSEDMSRAYQWEVSYDNMQSWNLLPGNESRVSYSDQTSLNPAFRFSTAASILSFGNEKCRFYSTPLTLQISKREYEIFDTICGGTFLELESGIFYNPGLYVEELTSSLGCDSIVMIHLDTVQREILDGQIINTDPLCFGDKTGIIEALDIRNGTPPYHLQINNLVYPDKRVENLASGNYVVLIKDRYNCFQSYDVHLADPEELIINLGPDQDIMLGEESHISLSSNLPLNEIFWSAPLEEFNGLKEIDFLPFDNLTVSVVGRAINGCEDADSLSISLDTEVSIYIPNVFKPLIDGPNSTFYISPFGKSLGTIKSFKIYDRWGSEVWRFSERNKTWNGTEQNGNFVIPGVYVFVIEGVLINNQKFQKTGTVTVIY